MNDLDRELLACNFPGCEAEAEHIEPSLLMLMCTEHKERVSAKLPLLVDYPLQWQEITAPLKELDFRKANANLERTILALMSLKITN